MQELLNLLKDKNGLSDQNAQAVLNTLTDFIKDKFPDAVAHMSGLTSSVVEESNSTAQEAVSSSGAASYIPEAALKNNEQISKDKQSGFYEGNKKDY